MGERRVEAGGTRLRLRRWGDGDGLPFEPAATRAQNLECAARMREVVPGAELRPVEGMRHAVFVDLGERAGTIAAEWLRETGIRGVRG